LAFFYVPFLAWQSSTLSWHGILLYSYLV
jgi:hypothetical protein